MRQNVYVCAMKKILIAVALAMLVILAGIFWQNTSAKSPAQTFSSCQEKKGTSLLYAKNFGVDSCGGFRILWVKNGKSDPLRWLLTDSLSPASVPLNLKALPRISVPAKRIAVLSSTYLGYLNALAAQRRIVAVDTKKYVADSAFFAWADSVNLAEVGEGMDISPEALYGLHADVIFSFSTGSSIHDAFPKLSKLKMPVLLTSEWLETSPLAKAEWLKFFGVIVGKESLADSLFAQSAARYEKIRRELAEIPAEDKPVVMTGGPVAGLWYASPGNSFTANLIRDAGGRYLWAADTSTDAFSMPFEKAFVDGQKATVWLNPGGVSGREELLARDRRLDHLPVWKTGEIYEYDLRKGPKGGLDFYESAVVKPDSLLEDVGKRLHPAKFETVPAKWYRKLSNI